MVGVDQVWRLLYRIGSGSEERWKMEDEGKVKAKVKEKKKKKKTATIEPLGAQVIRGGYPRVRNESCDEDPKI